MICPPVSSRLARRRSTSISRPSAMSTTALSAPEVTSASAGNVIHSACQPPSARSCSWTWAARMVAARLGATVAADSAAAAPTGLRLCGRVEEPPRPGARRLERLADLGLHHQRDVAGDLAAGAGEDARRRRRLRPGGRGGCARARRAVQVEQRREPLGHVEAVLAERRQRAGGAAELQHQRLPAQPAQPVARARQRRGIAGELEPERHRQRVLHQRARHRKRAAVACRRAW